MKALKVITAVLLAAAVFAGGVLAGNSLKKSENASAMSWNEYYNKSPIYDCVALDVGESGFSVLPDIDLEPGEETFPTIVGMEEPYKEQITSLYKGDDNGYTRVYERHEEVN